MRPRWQRTTRREDYTVDVTAFLSLMVILVPFLLVTAVFSRTAILELQLAAEEGGGPAATDALALQVTLRESVIEVRHRGQPEVARIDRTPDGAALMALAELAGNLKARYPQSLEATLLLEPQIPYDTLVKVLDVLRMRLLPQEEGGQQQVLFPSIALGTAPAAAQSPGAPL